MSLEEKISYITRRSSMHVCGNTVSVSVLISHLESCTRVFQRINVLLCIVLYRQWCLTEEIVCAANISLYFAIYRLMLFFRQWIINDKFALWDMRRDWNRAGVNKSYVTIALVISAKFWYPTPFIFTFSHFRCHRKVQCSVPFVILGKILIPVLYPIFKVGNFFDFPRLPSSLIVRLEKEIPFVRNFSRSDFSE